MDNGLKLNVWYIILSGDDDTAFMISVFKLFEGVCIFEVFRVGACGVEEDVFNGSVGW